MTQFSCEAAAIEYERGVLILGKAIRHLGKLAVRDADSRGDVPLIILLPLGPRIHNNRFLPIDLFSHILHRNPGDIPRNLFPTGKTCCKDLYIFITELFRLPGGFMTQLSGGAAAVEYEQGVLVLGKTIRHLGKLAVRDADSRGDVPLIILGLFGS